MEYEHGNNKGYNIFYRFSVNYILHEKTQKICRIQHGERYVDNIKQRCKYYKFGIQFIKCFKNENVVFYRNKLSFFHNKHLLFNIAINASQSFVSYRIHVYLLFNL